MSDSGDKQVVLITGSSRGLGLAIAERYLREGAVVTVSGSRQESVDKALEGLRKVFDDELMFPFVGDLTERDAIESLVDNLKARFGRVNIAIANLGGGSGLSGVAIAEHEWSRLFDLNLHSSRRLTEVLVERGAPDNALLYISSIAGCENLGAPIPYEVAKAALRAYSKAVSAKLAEKGVRVNVISPGNILAEGGTWEKKLKENPTEVAEMLQENVSMNRLGNAQEIANVVYFIASDDNSFMTGSNIIVDGGQVRFT